MAELLVEPTEGIKIYIYLDVLGPHERPRYAMVFSLSLMGTMLPLQTI